MKSVVVNFQGRCRGLSGQSRSPELEGSSVPQFPCSTCIVYLLCILRGHRNVEMRCGEGWGLDPRTFPLLHRLVRKPPFPNLDAPGGRVPRLPVASILRVRPELPHLLRFPSPKGPLRPGGLQRGRLAPGCEGGPASASCPCPSGQDGRCPDTTLMGSVPFLTFWAHLYPTSPTLGAGQS